MKVCLYGKRFEPAFADAVAGLLDQLIRRGVDVCVYGPFSRFLSQMMELPVGLSTFEQADGLKGSHFVISVGGDGTMLDAAALVRDRRIPVLGINTGRLGFLSNVAITDVQEAVEALMNGHFTLDRRSLIAVQSPTLTFGEFPFALNEVSLINRERNSMVTIHTYVNDKFMNSYWADGLIVATPTGSTAYSLSCGGPIVTPDSNNLILTPIAAHNLTVRPIVLSNSNKVTLRAEGREPHFQLNLDSRSFPVGPDDSIELTRAPFELNLVELEGQHFFHTIRTKMGWGVDRRN